MPPCTCAHAIDHHEEEQEDGTFPCDLEDCPCLDYDCGF